MPYTYDIKTSQKDNRSTISLSVCHLMYSIINLFLTTFLIAHIYTLTSDLYSYALNVGIYQLSCYGCMLVSYFLFSFLVDKSNRICVYRIANIIEAVLVIVTIFYGKDLAKIVVLAGLLNGLAHGAYYASYNVLKQEMVSRKSMDNFAVVLMILTKIVSVVCPILLGALIEISTFSMVAIYVLVLSIIQTVVSFCIKAKRPNESSFNLKEYFIRLKQNPKLTKKVKTIYIISIFYGITSVVSALLNINIMIHFGSSFSLGTITSVFALLTIVILILIKRFTKIGKRSWIFIVATILQIITTIIFIAIPNMITLIIYNLGYAICDVIIATIFDIIRNKNLKECGFYQDIAEHQCVIESVFQITRCLSFTMLIGVSLFKNYIIFQVLFVVFMILYSITPLMIMKYENNEKREKDRK